MDELRKKILLDTFVTPTTVLSFTGGLSMLMLSLVGQPLLGFLGFCSILFAIGIGAMNFFCRFDSISQNAIQQIERKKKEDRNADLDQLDLKLSSDRDPRDQMALRNLRSLYDSFSTDLQTGKVSLLAGASIHQQIDEIFDFCVQRLRFQHELWLTSRKVEGQSRIDLMKQKSEVMDEIEASVKCVSEIMSETRLLGMKAKQGELTKLQDRLRLQLESAKETQKIFEDIEQGNLNSEYQKS
jgi:hypothetical protein